jgi:hypothetical protein
VKRQKAKVKTLHWRKRLTCEFQLNIAIFGTFWRKHPLVPVPDTFLFNVLKNGPQRSSRPWR